MTIFDQQGKPLLLGAPLAQGGEGAIFKHPQHSNLLVKVYKQPSDEIRAQKLEALICIAKESPSKFFANTAWPIDHVYRQHNHNWEHIGFTMPKLDGDPIHSIYSPKERKQKFSTYSWKHLVAIARNAAIAFDQLHSLKVVLGDVNEGNFFVDSSGIVKLLDCDSYQITYNGVVYRCPVGVGIWTPPELQGKNFGSIARTANHDLFGLAVLIFQLLFIGRHPFANKWASENSLEEAIQRNLFGYSPALASQGIAKPPHSLDLSIVGGTVLRCFEQAFLAGSTFGDAYEKCPKCGSLNRIPRRNSAEQAICGSCRAPFDSGWHVRRPTAGMWVNALRELEASIEPCRQNKLHFHLRSGTCPFCLLDNVGFFAFLPLLTQHAKVGFEISDHILKLWQDIQSAPIPQSPLPRPTAHPCYGQPLPASASKTNPWYYVGWATLILGIIFSIAISWGFMIFAVIGFCMVSSGKQSSEFGSELRRRQAIVEQVKGEIRNLEQQFESSKRTGQSEILSLKRKAEPLFNELRWLPDHYKNALQELNKKRQEVQLATYLDRYFIHKKKFPGLGPKRRDMLQAYDIETALDVHVARSRPKGIPDETWKALKVWAESHAKSFVFNPNVSLPQQEVQNLQSRTLSRKVHLEQQLKQCEQDLKSKISLLQATLSAMVKKFDDLYRQLSQSEADVAVLKSA